MSVHAHGNFCNGTDGLWWQDTKRCWYVNSEIYLPFHRYRCALWQGSLASRVCTHTDGSFVCGCHSGFSLDASESNCTDRYMCALAGDTLCAYQKTSCLFTLLEPCVQVCSRVDPASHCCHNQIQWLIVGHRETNVRVIVAHLQYFPPWALW